MLLGAVASHVPRPVTVVTDAAYIGVAAALRGVDRAQPFEAPVGPGRVVDLQRDLRTLRRFPAAAKLRKHSIARRLRLIGIGRGRPAVAELYARAAGVDVAPLPWIATPERRRHQLVLVPAASTWLKAPRPELLAALGRRWSGPLTVLGGPHDGAAVATVAHSLPGATTLVERGFQRTIEVLATAAVVVGGDTGLLHLAYACGAPAVMIAGPTHADDGFLVQRDPVLGPYIVQRTLSCRPCTLHRGQTCRVGGRPCQDLEVAWLVDAVCRAGGEEARHAMGAVDR